jgi:hypothetical protein
MEIWKGIVVAGVLGLVGFLALSRPAVRNATVGLPKPAGPDQQTSPQPVPEPGTQKNGTLAASWRGDCNNSSTKTSGGVDLDYNGNTSNVNGSFSGTQTVTWRVDHDKLERVEIYVGGQLKETSSQSSASYTQDVTQGCLTAVLVYTR